MNNSTWPNAPMISTVLAAARRAGILVVIISVTLIRAQAQACLLGGWLPGVNHNMATGFPTAQTCTNGGTVPASYSTSFNAVHMALIPHGAYRGRVLVWDYVPGCVGLIQRWSLLNVSATTWPPTFQNYELQMSSQLPPNTTGDLFCAGHAWTKEGRLFVAGGTTQWPTSQGGYFVGGSFASLFDPGLIQAQGGTNAGNAPWLPQPPMSGNRWYPTVTLMGGSPPGTPPGADDNTLIVSGGSAQTGTATVPGIPLNTYEVFDSTFVVPLTGSWRSYGGSQALLGPTFTPNYLTLDNYPRMFVLSDGSVLMAGPQCQSYRLNHLATGPGMGPGLWTGPLGMSLDGQQDTRRLDGSAFLIPGIADAVAICGGRIQNSGSSGQNPVDYATNSIQSCFATATPTAFSWMNSASMLRPRYHSNATLCPDASVMVIGGHADISNAGTLTSSVYAPEKYFAGMLTAMTPGVSRRNYHSTTLLLPDGSILVAGGEGRASDYELFLPPYLACNYPRPIVTSSHNVINYGVSYTVLFNNQGTKVQKAVLMRPGSVTHHTDYDQRYVELACDLIDNATGTLIFNAPASPNEAPRGYYMLFIVTNKGTPSLASWVLLQ